MQAQKTFIHGLETGFVATQVLDVLSAIFYENLSEEDRLAEDRTRSGHQAYEVMANNFAKAAGYKLTEEQIKYFGWKFHRAFGIFGGVQYMMLRNKFPILKKGSGLFYGIAFFALADELMIYATKSTPGPTKFNWKAHLRGAFAHIAYGIACEVTAKTFDRISDYDNQTGWALDEEKGNPKLSTRAKARSAKPKSGNQGLKSSARQTSALQLSTRT